MMMPKSLLLPAGLVLAALALALSMLFWVGVPQGAAPAMPDNASPAPASKRADAPTTLGDGFGTDTFSSLRTTAAPSDNGAAISDEPGEPAMQPWEVDINRILESDEENHLVANRLLALAPSLPPEGQVEAIQHMVNLTDDDRYQNAASLLLSPATSEDVAQVIYADVLNRPNDVKLPLMVSLLRVPGHHLRGEALNTLQVFLGENFGDNPDAWNSAVQNYLVKEAQSDAAAALEAGEAQ